jgi:hypothetical protein
MAHPDRSGIAIHIGMPTLASRGPVALAVFNAASGADARFVAGVRVLDGRPLPSVTLRSADPRLIGHHADCVGCGPVFAHAIKNAAIVVSEILL